MIQIHVNISCIYVADVCHSLGILIDVSGCMFYDYNVFSVHSSMYVLYAAFTHILLANIC